MNSLTIEGRESYRLTLDKIPASLEELHIIRQQNLPRSIFTGLEKLTNLKILTVHLDIPNFDRIKKFEEGIDTIENEQVSENEKISKSNLKKIIFIWPDFDVSIATL